MRCLARLIRRVMVASGTRKARAISAVVRPPTARRVSAICEAGDSDGWQHRNSRTSVSSDVGRRSRRRPRRQPFVGQRPAGDGVLAALPGLLAAQQIGQPARRDRDQPASRVVRDAVRRPLGRRPRAAPPAPRPRRCRSARSAGPARRGPAAPAGAAGPRRRRPARTVLRAPARRGPRRSAGRRRTPRPARARAGQFASRAAISVARSKLSHSTIV